jgi:leucyl/phenylalanyl-tRNA--protein transferase
MGVMWSDIDLERADEDGLIAIGGDLEPETLVDAYRHGIFPWYDEDSPICWWSPDPRAIFELDQFHIPRRLARTCRSGKFAVTINRAFSAVIRGCADRSEGTWITTEMMSAYEHLHRLGHVHSIETWCAGELAGGVYGVALGGLFAAESMFYRYTDASKVALVHLYQRLCERGFVLFDTQMVTPTTLAFGATEIPRREYLRRLRRAVALPVTFV